MYFIGTRGGERVTGAQAVVRGMAEGGGLYVPEEFPSIREEMEEMLGMDYAERLAVVLGKFFDEYPKDGLLNAAKEAFENFESEDPVPLVKIEEGLYILELFHGPTCGHTDLGVYLLPYLLKQGCEITGVKRDILLLTATSGDSGKSVMEAFRDQKGIRAVVVYPDEGVSKMQKLQLTTQDGDNLLSIGVKGNFDECQSAVKKILRQPEKRDKLQEKVHLTTASSINVGQLLSRVAAYISAYLDLVSSEQIAMGDKVDFSLPAGNLGGLLAAFYAKKMGLPIGKIVAAGNRNNSLGDFFAKGVFDRKKPFMRTMSPSLDVLNASNLERLIFELSSRDEALTIERMKSAASTGKYALRAEEFKILHDTFFGGNASEEETVECVYEFFEEFNYPLDTHTAVAVHAARLYNHSLEDSDEKTRPMVVVATDSPYKFPQAVYYALTGNDVKDSFKGLKRIHLITAMKVPEALKALRYKPATFKTVVSSDKVFDEVLNFIS